MKPELIFYAGSSLLEGPIWDTENKLVYCVSIEQSLIYAINPETGHVKSFPTNGHVGCVALNNNEELLSAEKEGVYSINPNSGSRTFIKQFEPNEEMRYNDGTTDPIGRFLVGTKGYLKELPNMGKLYSYHEGELKVIVEGTTISNGIGFSKNGSKMYFIDTPTKKVGQYNYNPETGEAQFEKYIIEIDGTGWPDGLCVDLDGNIWVAEWQGSRVCKWNPETGVKLTEVKLPCKNVTSCCLGGDHNEFLFITTAKEHKNSNELAGGLFKIKL